MKDIRNNFIPIEEALEMKELGFDEPCFAYYEVNKLLKDDFRLRYVEHEDTNPTKQPQNNSCLAPLYQQAFEFFRERYKLHTEPIRFIPKLGNYNYKIWIENDKIELENLIFPTSAYDTPEKAQLECLRTLIKIVKDKSL